MSVVTLSKVLCAVATLGSAPGHAPKCALPHVERPHYTHFDRTIDVLPQKRPWYAGVIKIGPYYMAPPYKQIWADIASR